MNRLRNVSSHVINTSIFKASPVHRGLAYLHKRKGFLLNFKMCKTGLFTRRFYVVCCVKSTKVLTNTCAKRGLKLEDSKGGGYHAKSIKDFRAEVSPS